MTDGTAVLGSLGYQVSLTALRAGVRDAPTAG